MRIINATSSMSNQLFRLNEISLGRWWPTLSAPVLAWTELEQDTFYPLLETEMIGTLLDRALQYGKQAAEEIQIQGSPERLIDHIIHSGIRIRFLTESADKKWVRAQYRSTPPTIDVYSHSLHQLVDFFQKTGFRVRQEDVIALHLVHEWFHHLESSRWGRTDLKLPQVAVHIWGPIHKRRSLTRTREIAAHAFTQEVMGLSWYPLLLDHLLLLLERGATREQIREHFTRIKSQYQEVIALNKI